MLTVLLATHNGAQTLDRTLESFTSLKSPRGGYRIVVVDNASSDKTPEIIKSFKDRLPLTYVRSERQGKNVALNVGLGFLEGDLIVLTDDDVLPNQEWLIQHRRMADMHPEVAMWGGTIKPRWPAPPPSWILKQVPLGAVYAATNTEEKTGPIAPDLIWGPNMAVRREIFQAGYKFNEQVGPAAGNYIMGSETEFTRRVAKDGHKTWFLKDAIVEHLIRPNQMERRWIIGRALRFGKAKYLTDKLAPQNQSGLWRRAPRWRYGAVLRSSLRRFFSILNRNESACFKAEWDRQYHLGYISAAWADRGQEKPH